MAIPDSIGLGIALFLAWLFGQAAFHKFSAADYYSELIVRYVPVAPSGAAFVWLVAALEAAIAVSLLLSPWREFGLEMAAAVLLLYAAAMATEIMRGRAGSQCGCAGPDSRLGVSWPLVIRNGACAALALLAQGAAYTDPLGVPGWVLAGFVALFVALVYVTTEQIVSNAQWMAGEA